MLSADQVDRAVHDTPFWVRLAIFSAFLLDPRFPENLDLDVTVLRYDSYKMG